MASQHFTSFYRDHQMLKEAMERVFQNQSYLAPLTGQGPSSLQSLGYSVCFSGKLMVNTAANVEPRRKHREAFCPGAFCSLQLLKNTPSTAVLSLTPSAFSANTSPEADPFAFPNLYFIPFIISYTGETITPSYSTYKSIHMCINKRITLPTTKRAAASEVELGSFQRA